MAKAYEMPFGRLTVDPAIDFENKRYTFVTVNEDGLGITAVADTAVVGVIQEPNGVAEPAQVTSHGVSYVMLGGAVKAGDSVSVGADGTAVKATTGVIVGICVAGGAKDDIGSVLLK